jgi:hypothetical protein
MKIDRILDLADIDAIGRLPFVEKCFYGMILLVIKYNSHD